MAKNVKITVTPKKGGSPFIFPSLPNTINIQTGVMYQSFDILSKGTIKIPKGRDSAKVSWSHVFFGKQRKGSPVVLTGQWKRPKDCINILQKWEYNGTELTITASGIGVSLNIDVTVSSFSFSPEGAYGDVSYSISFEEVRSLQVYTTKEKKVGGGKKKTKERSKKKEGGTNKGQSSKQEKSYTVDSGDTLWGVAKRFCGGGANWTKIYDKNSEAIEADAKKHGRENSNHGNWIWPGLKLTLP